MAWFPAPPTPVVEPYFPASDTTANGQANGNGTANGHASPAANGNGHGTVDLTRPYPTSHS
ncbi:MAG TPA: hypothetical protein VIM19_15425 [Actinomycetes bacterium]